MNEEHPLQRLALDLRSFVWPAHCLGCGTPNRDWCAACRDAFHSSHHVVDIVPRVHPGRTWCASGHYAGMRKVLIGRLKHRGQLSIARHLGIALRTPLMHLTHGIAGTPLIVPIPSRPQRVRTRGYRHLELVLRHTGMPGWREGARLLVPLAGRTGQVGLDERERKRNAERLTLAVTPRVAGRSVILIDDIVTTGATLAAADNLLTEAGARVMGAAVIAATQRLDDADQKNSQT